MQASALRGLTVVALTDHDTTQGVQEAVTAGRRLGIWVIPGIEFSASTERGELHLLGYGVDVHHERLQSRLAELRDTRMSRATRIVERLSEIGVHLPEDLLERFAGQESVGRPHIARALMEVGLVESVSEAFDRYLGRGRPGFVFRELIDPAEAIQLVRDAGGIAVLAHPFSVPDFREHVLALVDAGLAGIECYYGGYNHDQRIELAAFARDLGLLATGGSDYHGPDARAGRELGSVTIPQDSVDALLNALGDGSQPSSAL